MGREWKKEQVIEKTDKESVRECERGKEGMRGQYGGGEDSSSTKSGRTTNTFFVMSSACLREGNAVTWEKATDIAVCRF